MGRQISVSENGVISTLEQSMLPGVRRITFMEASESLGSGLCMQHLNPRLEQVPLSVSSLLFFTCKMRDLRVNEGKGFTGFKMAADF